MHSLDFLSKTEPTLTTYSFISYSIVCSTVCSHLKCYLSSLVHSLLEKWLTWTKFRGNAYDLKKKTNPPKKKPNQKKPNQKSFSSASLCKGKVVFPLWAKFQKLYTDKKTTTPLGCSTSLASKLWNPWHSKPPNVSHPLTPRTLDFSELTSQQPSVKVGKRHSLGLQAMFELLTNNTGLKSLSSDTSSTK